MLSMIALTYIKLTLPDSWNDYAHTKPDLHDSDFLGFSADRKSLDMFFFSRKLPKRRAFVSGFLVSALQWSFCVELSRSPQRSTLS
jgi:hypothetical protein